VDAKSTRVVARSLPGQQRRILMASWRENLPCDAR